MSRFEFRLIVGDPAEHPSVRAWETVTRSLGEVRTVERLETSKGGPPNRKSRVYRLRGPELPHGSVMAKLGPCATIETERIVYDEVLPQTGVPCLKAYGALPEDATTSWLFLDEAVGRRLDLTREDDQELAAELLGRIHTSTSQARLELLLPRHDLDRYVKCEEQATRQLTAAVGHRGWSADERELFGALLTSVSSYATRREAIRHHLNRMPQCLVHGDIAGKNAFVRDSDGRQQIQLFDWDIAGIGAPAIDLELISCELYHRQVVPTWPAMSVRSVEAMRTVGKVPRFLGLIAATTASLDPEWRGDTIELLEAYLREFRASLDALERAL